MKSTRLTLLVILAVLGSWFLMVADSSGGASPQIANSVCRYESQAISHGKTLFLFVTDRATGQVRVSFLDGGPDNMRSQTTLTIPGPGEDNAHDR